MTRVVDNQKALAPLAYAAERAIHHRSQTRPLHPTATKQDLRTAFCIALPEDPRGGVSVIDDLIAAADPGLVGNTDGNFFAWVMGESAPVGVAADWLTSAWGQNAAIYQTAPAAAVAEEAVSAWLLDLLNLPRDASVGFATGATMAAFVGFAAARTAVLARAGHDYEADGLQGAPQIKVYMSDESHETNRVALRHIGMGEANFVRLPSDDQGRMDVSVLASSLAAHDGPKIVLAQAGHINSGAFEDFEAICALASRHDAWVHVDGAFGLWARVDPGKRDLTRGLNLADSWSVDGHKWLQIPYDSGFAIVRDSDAHRRAMDITASYLTEAKEDGRNPTHFAPELSRRARGFAAWAIFQSLGRSGVRTLVARHCACARLVADRLQRIDGLEVLNVVHLNQIALSAIGDGADEKVLQLAARLNAKGHHFVRTAVWQDRTILRLSIIGQRTSTDDAKALVAALEACWSEVRNYADPSHQFGERI